MMSCTDAPSSRFSNSAAMGTLLPTKSHAPLTLSGSVSTALHVDQSIVSIFLGVAQ